MSLIFLFSYNLWRIVLEKFNDEADLRENEKPPKRVHMRQKWNSKRSQFLEATWSGGLEVEDQFVWSAARERLLQRILAEDGGRLANRLEQDSQR